MSATPSNCAIGRPVPALRGSGYVSFVRPANTTAYTAGDVVSQSATATGLLTFPVARSKGGGGYIVKALLETNLKTFLSQMRLYLFTVREPTISVVGDNVAQTILWVNASYRLGYVEFPTLVSGAGSGSTAATAMFTGNVPFRCAEGDDAIYGYLVDNTGSTPASSQVFGLQLEADAY